MNALYNLNFPMAFDIFDQMVRNSPTDPAGYFGSALAWWWELEVRLGESSPKDEDQFEQAVKQAITVAEQVIDKEPGNAKAFLCLGGVYGLRGRREAFGHHWLSALFDGRRTRRYQSRALELDPQLEDAYLGIGLFDYYVATLPAVIRALSFLGRGDREKGLQELDRAATKSLFSRTAARLLLISINTGPEKKPLEALRLAEELMEEYPESPFMRLMELMVLFENHDGVLMERRAREFIDRINQGAPRYETGDLTRGHFMLGAALSVQGKWSQAVEALSRAIQAARPTDPYLTSTLVCRGEAYDVLGQRPSAIADYKRALGTPKFWDYQKEAQHHLREPYHQPALSPPDQTNPTNKL